MTFDSFDFDRRINAGIAACGFTAPTPIQAAAIPSVLRGKDVLGLAQTGTGKTAAFALPLLQRIIREGSNKGGPLRVLVLAPTRELALQIHESFIALGRQTGLRSAAVFGGVGLVPQIRALRNASIAVACPGRLLDLLNRKEVDLSRIEALVLDEADRMFDMGFLPDLKKIFRHLPRNRQNLLFSATMPSEIRSLCDELLNDPETVQVDTIAPAKSVSHVLYPVAQRQKAPLLEALLDSVEYESMLIFTRTKHKAKVLAQKLGRRGHRATFLQGNLSQSRRQEALDGFRKGKYSIMVATDIAARGIDCASITHVVNYDVPDTVETYTHRIGRTGRADRTGKALTFVTGEDRFFVRSVERTLGRKIDRESLDGFAYAEAEGESDSSARRGNDRRAKESAERGRRPAGKKRYFSSREKSRTEDAEAGRRSGGAERRSSRAASSEKNSRQAVKGAGKFAGSGERKGRNSAQYRGEEKPVRKSSGNGQAGRSRRSEGKVQGDPSSKPLTKRVVRYNPDAEFHDAVGADFRDRKECSTKQVSERPRSSRNRSGNRKPRRGTR